MAESVSLPRLPGELPRKPPCPFCESEDTELHSLFGSHASVTTYWCRSCRSPFEQMKWGRRFGPPGTSEPRKGDILGSSSDP
jgi:hypothetical protein